MFDEFRGSLPATLLPVKMNIEYPDKITICGKANFCDA